MDEDTVIIIGIITVICTGLIIHSVIYVWNQELASSYSPIAEFPKMEVKVEHYDNEIRITFTHKDGDPVEWSNYDIRILNETDNSDSFIMLQLHGTQVAGENKIITNITHPELDDIQFQIGSEYTIEIYKIKENKRVLLAESRTLEAGIEK